jgi:aminopeptidase N
VKNKRAIVPGEVATEEEVYSGGDIYLKGSFFMHSLRCLIGDDIFFPTLKRLATDEAYTYHNFVTTDDVEKLFSKAYGKDLKPFFDFYLHTTNVIDVHVKEVGFQKYQVKVNNFFMPLPFEIAFNGTTTTLVIPAEGILVQSVFPPVVDPRGNYLKKVTIQ